MSPASTAGRPGSNEATRGVESSFKSDFHHAIGDLAQQAREDDRRVEEEAARRARPSPYARFIRIGLALIALQGALFVYLYVRAPHPAAIKHVTTRDLFPKNDCNAALYRAYWKIVAFWKDQGSPPASLDQLLGKYFQELPVDPVSGKPLEYSTDGRRFELRCPGVRSAAAPVG